MDAFFDKFLRKTAWLWLPFFALYKTILGIIAFIEEREAEKRKIEEA